MFVCLVEILNRVFAVSRCLAKCGPAHISYEICYKFPTSKVWTLFCDWTNISIKFIKLSFSYKHIWQIHMKSTGQQPGSHRCTMRASHQGRRECLTLGQCPDTLTKLWRTFWSTFERFHSFKFVMEQLNVSWQCKPKYKISRSRIRDRATIFEVWLPDQPSYWSTYPHQLKAWQNAIELLDMFYTCINFYF